MISPQRSHVKTTTTTTTTKKKQQQGLFLFQLNFTFTEVAITGECSSYSIWGVLLKPAPASEANKRIIHTRTIIDYNRNHR